MGNEIGYYQNLIEDLHIPDDHCRQTNAGTIVKKIFDLYPHIQRVLDLGCGTGDSIDFFRKMAPDIEWIGLDMESSPEVLQRSRTDAAFCSFDGVNIPFGDGLFELIFCNQVLEHVRHPQALLQETRRVLKTDGYFIGSTSHLEPYHSYSTWNYTPYGFKRLMEDAGFTVLEIRPGIDGLTLIVRAALGRPAFFSRWWKNESPMNKMIGLIGRILNKSKKEINFAKLMLCGQFCFIAQRK